MFSKLPKVNLKKGTLTLDRLLEKTLSAGNFKYEESFKNTIIIEELSVPQKQHVQNGTKITGKVTDTYGKPIPNATVYVSSSKEISQPPTNSFSINGTVTDSGGSFTVSAEIGYYLSVWAMGYEVYAEQVNKDKSFYGIMLKNETLALD